MDNRYNMKKYVTYRFFAISMIFLLYGICFIPLSTTQLVDHNYEQSQKTTFAGQILYSPICSTQTYLIDKTGAINHTWSSDYLPGMMVYWLGNGTILRSIRTGGAPNILGAGGGVQIIQWDGTIVWDFRYNGEGDFCHHDVKLLPNGNVLLIVWEEKTSDEVLAAGGNPWYRGALMPDYISEVQPAGSTNGTIVWEWHAWDHLIQDYDSSKANFGVVKDHPELIDINYIIEPALASDFMHTNSIDYNEEFDQILISVRHFNEIWIIDHSTTTAEAASHTGGNSGKGGDLLYRWGNPATYRAGTSDDHKLFMQHDAKWIDDGYPGAGNILIFNNGMNRPTPYSSVDEITPPVNENGEYYLQSGSAYGPSEQTWIYTANPDTSFYAYHVSGAQRLRSGNTLICDGAKGIFFEVSTFGKTVWTYTNPYPTLATNSVFKIDYIPSDNENSSNQPPYTPRNPTPADGTMGVSVNIELRWKGGDPDPDDTVTYDVYFGTQDPKKVSSQSTTSYNPGLLSGGTHYYWRIAAWDSNGQLTVGPLWDFATKLEGNTPPSTPTITGETHGSTQTTYYYTIRTTDPDQHKVQYYIDWDDNTTTFTGDYESGEEISISHKWNTEGIYRVKVKAIDEYWAESNWGTLPVIMPYPYNKPMPQFLELLFQRFPNVFPLLRHQLGY